ncbi:hypothetical protein M501DRAFT_1006238 [Patellaria atrata CBS 101060]|uniref:Uncharacterized protein n=1 Tax=Patellaria atrata CBS 101060 TaxID=1346257 RepID=A0A9P4SIW6_9PEZI|nr:hypothetical protein M501DRAFT_1006238 [Patellaria atrata CBS 101060]
MRAHTYKSLEDLNSGRDTVPWYWRVVALAASWMILGGYLILPATYDKDPKLRFSDAVLDVLIGALLTAGYSFTGLLCFACSNWIFQAEAVFLPALQSSALGLLTLIYCFLSSSRYQFGTGAIVATALSLSSTLVYSGLLLWTYRRIARVRKPHSSSHSITSHSGSSYYSNFLTNMYPSSRHTAPATPLTEDELVSQQMAALLKKADPGPSPEASRSTFNIDWPADDEENTPRDRLSPPTLGVRGRDERGRGLERESAEQERARSREERRAEIELGGVSRGHSGYSGHRYST